MTRFIFWAAACSSAKAREAKVLPPPVGTVRVDLSVRSYNCLKRAGIHSVRQLVEFSENDLLNIRNFGAKSIEEVKDKLISMDLNLKL